MVAVASCFYFTVLVLPQDVVQQPEIDAAHPGPHRQRETTELGSERSDAVQALLQTVRHSVRDAVSHREGSHMS